MKSPWPHSCCFPLGIMPSVFSEGGCWANGQPHHSRQWLMRYLPEMRMSPGLFPKSWVTRVYVFFYCLLHSYINSSITYKLHFRKKKKKKLGHQIFVLFFPGAPRTLFHGDWLTLFTVLFYEPWPFCRPPEHGHRVILLVHFLVTRMY